MSGVTNTNARSTTIDAYLTHVGENIAKSGKLQDAVGRACPLLQELTSKGRIEDWDGGRNVDVNLMYDFTAGFKAIGPYGKIDLVGSDGITQASFPCSEYSLPVLIDGPQIRANK